MKIKINEDTRYAVSNVLIEIMDNVKTSKKYLNTITLEGLTLILQKLKTNGKSQALRDLVKNYVDELKGVTVRYMKKLDTKTDGYIAKCMLETFLRLASNEGSLDEIYHFNNKQVTLLKYSDEYHSYTSLY